MTPSQILVIDDDADVCQALADILQSEGYSVSSAPDGMEALRYLRSHGAPNLILLDLMMPVMNGWQFLTEQSRDPALANIPVVVLSAVSRDPNGLVSIDHLAFLKKPVHLEHLLAAVERYCTATTSR
jgi:CheY-like chemotaxis protein